MDGFQRDVDLFGYGQFGNRLADLVAASEDEPVVLIDGDWGSGKTVFALQWAGLLRQRGNAVLYVDAFASDHQDDAFLALVEAVYGFADDRGVKDTAKQAFSAVAARVGTLALLKGVGRQVPGFDVTAVVEEVAESIKQRASGLQEWIEKAKARREVMEEFRDAFEELAQASVEAAQQRVQDGDSSTAGKDASGNPDSRLGRLVIVVDELDRCRPDFALALLERIKHVFGVPGVCFVLVTNFAQLQQSVKRAYGDVEAMNYLEKFYDLRFRLPAGGRSGRRSKTGVYAERLWGQLGWKGSAAFRSLAESERMSLRTMEHVMRNILVLATAMSNSFFGWVPSGVLISVIRVVRPGLFGRIERGEALEDDTEVIALKLAAVRGDANFVRPGLVSARGEEIPESLAKELGKSWGLQEAARCLSAFDF